MKLRITVLPRTLAEAVKVLEVLNQHLGPLRLDESNPKKKSPK